MQITRWFTTEDQALSESIHTSSWNSEAAELLATESFCTTLPQSIKTVEENTLPSWLWRHTGSGAHQAAEYSLQQIFDRIAGSATYKGWKKDLFSNEKSARTFFDEARHLLSAGYMTLDPAAMAGLGIDWAYGLATVPLATTSTDASHSLDLSNQSIDAILGGSDNGAKNRWHRFLETKAGQKLTVRFSDTASEWGTNTTNQTPRLVLDLNKFLREDGNLDCSGLQQATRVAVILMELHYESLIASPQAPRSLAISPVNLASLLMQQGLAYDSKEGRAMAAGIASLITGTATFTSAKMSQQFGPCADFINDRTTSLRVVANRRRAVYGDMNDYEHLSVVPTPLTLGDCPDLALVAEARRTWDEALVSAQRYGLRHAQLTNITTSPDFAVLFSSTATGLAPEPSLVIERRVNEDHFNREIHPAVPRALAKLGYSAADTQAIITHVIGHGTLKSAPTINHETLAARGFSSDVIAKVEAYLGQVNDITLACTPWIVGEKFCRETLKIAADKLEDFSFDLLAHLGFAAGEVIAANHFCYGHGNVETASELKHEHHSIFVCGEDVSITAQTRMAASVQPYISADIDMTLAMPVETAVEARSDLLIEAWKQGLKAVTLYFEYDNKIATQPEQRHSLTKPRRRLVTGKPAPQSAMPKAMPVLAAAQKTAAKSSGKIVSIGKKGSLHAPKAKA